MKTVASALLATHSFLAGVVPDAAVCFKYLSPASFVTTNLAPASLADVALSTFSNLAPPVWSSGFSLGLTSFVESGLVP